MIGRTLPQCKHLTTLLMYRMKAPSASGIQSLLRGIYVDLNPSSQLALTRLGLSGIPCRETEISKYFWHNKQPPLKSKWN